MRRLGLSFSKNAVIHCHTEAVDASDIRHEGPENVSFGLCMVCPSTFSSRYECVERTWSKENDSLLVCVTVYLTLGAVMLARYKLKDLMDIYDVSASR